MQTSQAPDTLNGPAGTKYVFKGWMVDGVLQPGNPISITMDKTHKAVATYETQYQLLVDSQYGDAKGAGYYANGSTAVFSVTTPVGFLIQQVFLKWDGDPVVDQANKYMEATSPARRPQVRLQWISLSGFTPTGSRAISNSTSSLVSWQRWLSSLRYSS